MIEIDPSTVKMGFCGEKGNNFSDRPPFFKGTKAKHRYTTEVFQCQLPGIWRKHCFFLESEVWIVGKFMIYILWLSDIPPLIFYQKKTISLDALPSWPWIPGGFLSPTCWSTEKQQFLGEKAEYVLDNVDVDDFSVNFVQESSNRTHCYGPQTCVSLFALATYLGVRW